MPITSAEENQLSEQFAKYVALQEMLGDDVECESPSKTEFANAAQHLPLYKQAYLDLRVAYKKYKLRFVTSVVSEEEFNVTESEYTYNDPWLEDIKKDFYKFNKTVLKFLENNPSEISGEEEKFSLAAQKVELDRLVSI